MRLFCAERLALRIQGGSVGPEQRLQVGEPALAIRGRRSDDGEQPLRQPSHERRDEHRRTRTGQPADARALAGSRELFQQRPRGGKVVEPVQQKIEGH